MGSGNYNYALNKPATASSYILPYTPDRAVNGTLSAPSDRWTSAFWNFQDDKLFYKVDFGAAYSISRYVIKSICDLPTGSSDSWPDSYENLSIYVSYSMDNQVWVDLDECSVVEKTIDHEFNSVNARYFMLTFPKATMANPNFVSIAQLEVYNTASKYLKALTLSAGTLSPTFSGSTQFNYKASVDESVTSITLTPTAISPSASIMVNNQAVSSGTASYPVPLSSDGTTNIYVDVSDSSMSQRYTLQVTKSVISSYIKTLIMHKNDVSNSVVALTPVFNGHNSFNYTASVEYDALKSGNASTKVNVTPTSEVASAAITVNNEPVASGSVSPYMELNVGSDNIIQVTCLASQNTAQMQTYTIAVTKASSPYLSNVMNMPTNITFSSTTLNYTGSTKASNTPVTVVSEDPAAHITVQNGSITQQVVSGNTVTITFTNGQNIVTIIVNSATGTDSRTYTFTINKT